MTTVSAPPPETVWSVNYFSCDRSTRPATMAGLLTVRCLLAALLTGVYSNAIANTNTTETAPAASPALQTLLNSSTDTSSTLGNDTALSTAKRCAESLALYYSWSQRFQSWTTIAVTVSVPASSFVLPAYNATRTTTLCDGNPRVIGLAAGGGSRTIVVAATYTTYSTEVYTLSPYPSPTPSCSINPQDCKELYAMNSSLVHPIYLSEDSLATICSTQPASASTAASTVRPVSFGQGASPQPVAFGQGASPTPAAFGPLPSQCSQCIVVAAAAKLLYWPVKIEEGTDDSCNIDIASPHTLTGTQTGQGPNIAVTEGITITSPSVAISLIGISRKDGCYNMTISSTIIPVDLSDVTSIRGGTFTPLAKRSDHPISAFGIASQSAPAGYVTSDYQPFRFQDLSYHCIGANGSASVAFGPGPNCYPLVPSQAYFSAPDMWKWDNGGKRVLPMDSPCHGTNIHCAY